jgi:WD40 repeat protein
MKTHLFFLVLIGLFIFCPLSIDAQDENTPNLDALVPLTVDNATEISELSRLEQKTYLSDLAFSPDGNVLASVSFYSYEGVRLWDMQQPHQQPTRLLKGFFGTVAFSANGELLAIGGEASGVEPCECNFSTVYLFDTETYQQRALLLGYGGQDNGVSNLAFNPQSTKLVTVDTNVTLWDIDEALQSEILEIRRDMIIAKPDSQHFFSDVIFSSDGTLIAYTSSKNEFSETLNKFITAENQIIFWDVNKQMVQQVLHEEVNNVPIIAFNHDGSLLASGSTEINDYDNNFPVYSEGSPITLRDVRNGQQKAVLTQDNGISYIVFSNDGSLLAAGDFAGNVHLYDVKSAEELTVLTGHSSRVVSLAFSPDGKLLASGGDSTIRLWGVPAN